MVKSPTETQIKVEEGKLRKGKTDRQTDTDRERYRDKEKDTQRDRDRQIDRGRQTDGQTNKKLIKKNMQCCSTQRKLKVW